MVLEEWRRHSLANEARHGGELSLSRQGSLYNRRLIFINDHPIVLAK